MMRNLRNKIILYGWRNEWWRRAKSINGLFVRLRGILGYQISKTVHIYRPISGCLGFTGRLLQGWRTRIANRDLNKNRDLFLGNIGNRDYREYRDLQIGTCFLIDVLILTCSILIQHFNDPCVSSPSWSGHTLFEHPSSYTARISLLCIRLIWMNGIE